MSGSGTMTLTGAFPFQGKLDLRKVDLSMLRRLAPRLRSPIAVGGAFTFDIDGSGTLNPVTLNARGSAGATDLKLEKFTASTVQLKWDSDGKHLKLNDIQAVLYRGQLTGQASLPLQPKETGSIDVSFDNVDLGELATSLPPLPVRLEGRADGTIKATLPAETAAGQRDLATDLTLRSPQLKLQGIPAQKVEGTVTYKERKVAYRFEGDTLGGTFHVEGKAPVARPANQRPRRRPVRPRAGPGLRICA